MSWLCMEQLSACMLSSAIADTALVEGMFHNGLRLLMVDDCH